MDVSCDCVTLFLLILLLCFIAYYFLVVAQPIQIYVGNETQKEFLGRLTTLQETFYPTIFYWHGLLQTIMGQGMRMTKSLPYKRTIFDLKDGGQVGLDFMQPHQSVTNDRRVLTFILPGLTSTSQSPYIKTLVMSCVRAGSTVVVMNNRGLGGVPLKVWAKIMVTPRAFSGTNCEDVAEVMNYLKKEYPSHTRIAIGTSLGGIILSHYLSKKGKEASEILSSALLLSIVWDAHVGSQAIERPFIKQILNYSLAQGLKDLVRENQAIFETVEGWEDCQKILKRTHTVRDFDANFTAPKFNYRDVNDYYDDVTVLNRIQHFTIPVFALSARDDPIASGEALPVQQSLAKGSNLALIVTERGGHLGFLEGFLPRPKTVHFMERFVHEFLISFE